MHRKLLVLLALLALCGLLTGLIACDDLVTEVTEITVFGPPEAEFDADVDVGCKDSLVVQFTDESTGFGIEEWIWVFNENLPESLQDTSFEQNPTFTYRGAGFYDVRLIVTDSAGQSDGELKTRFIWLTEPQAIFEILPNDTGCQDTRFELINRSVGVADDFVWYIANQDSSYFDSTYRTQVDLEGLPPGAYSIMLIADGGDTCGVDTLVDTLVVGNCPQFRFDVNGLTSGRDSICATDDVTITYVDSGGPIDSVVVDWNINDTLFTVVQGDPSFVTDNLYEEEGLYSVDVIAAGPGGADTATLSNIIQVFEPLTAAFTWGYDGDSVAPAIVQFSSNPTTGSKGYGASYTWEVEYPDTVTGTVLTAISLTPNADDQVYDSAGFYQVMLTAFNNCNIGSPTVFIDTVRIYDSTEVK